MTESGLPGKRMTGRRQFLAGLAVLPFGLAGCSVAGAGGPTPTVSADPGAFPATIRHAFGETTIAKQPVRVATLGLGANDSCLALGVVPVAMPLSKAKPNGSTPWFDLALLGFGVDVPMLLDEDKELPVAALADLGPDVILAVNSRLTREEYEQLSKIAPVVAYPAAPLDTDWRTSLDMVAQALGRSAKAAEVRKATEASITDQLGNYPDLKGSSFVFAKVRSALGAAFEVFGTESNPVRILKEFGVAAAPSMDLVQSQGTALHPGGTGPQTYEWPRGRAPELAADLAVFSIVHEERAGVLGSGILNEVPPFKNNNFVLVDSADNGLALETASPLSVQWVAKNLLPQVAQAAYGAKNPK